MMSTTRISIAMILRRGERRGRERSREKGRGGRGGRGEGGEQVEIRE